MTVKPEDGACEPPAGKQSSYEPDRSDYRPALLTVRAAVIFIAALVIGVGAGILTWFTSHILAAAVLAGAAACGAAVTFLNAVISN